MNGLALQQAQDERKSKGAQGERSFILGEPKI
jgi:hypothetical protein